MKYLITFLAGLVSGVGIVLWWGGKKNDTPIIERDKDGKITSIYSRKLAINFDPLLADTQPIRTDNA